MTRKRKRYRDSIDNPYKALAASIVYRAIRDIRYEDMKLSGGPNKDLMRISYDAEIWLITSPWAKTLLDYLDIDISPTELLETVRERTNIGPLSLQEEK